MTNKHGNDILGMDIKLLKIACPVISKSLAYVVNSSLDNDIVHDDWKKARVTPVYQNKGEINVENNFRPISVISHIAKMIESFVSNQIIKYLEDHAFISIDQSAYLKRHSTQTSLHKIIDYWLEQINDNSLTGACLLDISKCFDTVNHEILLKKLEMYVNKWYFSTGLFRLSWSVQWGSSGFCVGTLVIFTIYWWCFEFYNGRVRFKYVCWWCDYLYFYYNQWWTTNEIAVMCW